MGKLTLKIDDNIETELKIYILKNKGPKGELSKTVEEIIDNFLKPIKISDILTIDKEIEDKTKNKLTSDNEIELKSSLIDFLKLWLIRYKIADFDFPLQYDNSEE